MASKEIEMIDRYIDRDQAANLLERRWFSSIAAVRAAQAECEVLREVVELAEKAWRRSRTQLAEIEALRDALGDQLTALDEYEAAGSRPATRRVMSAA
jgi:hypothetical protein